MIKEIDLDLRKEETQKGAILGGKSKQKQKKREI